MDKIETKVSVILDRDDWEVFKNNIDKKGMKQYFIANKLILIYNKMCEKNTDLDALEKFVDRL